MHNDLVERIKAIYAAAKQQRHRDRAGMAPPPAVPAPSEEHEPTGPMCSSGRGSRARDPLATIF
jgi:hypothetical protein